MSSKSHHIPQTIHQLAKFVSGTVIGNGERTVSLLCPAEAPVADGLTFVKSERLVDIKAVLARGPVGGMLVLAKLAAADLPAETSYIQVADPFDALLKLVPIFHKTLRPPPGVSPQAAVDPSAEIATDVSIGPFCAIGAGVKIGAGAVIHPNVTIYPDVTIGAGVVIHAGAVVREGCTLADNVIIQNGAVIGADGFGFVPDPKLGLRSVPQIGVVALESNVEVGANACIDRATLGQTKVGRGTKIDNLVQVGHNVQIGQHSILCGQVGVAGSSNIGNGVVLGGGAGVADHVTLVDGVRVGARGGVISDIDKPGDYVGYPAVPAKEWRRAMAAVRRLGKRS